VPEPPVSGTVHAWASSGNPGFSPAGSDRGLDPLTADARRQADARPLLSFAGVEAVLQGLSGR